MTWYPSDKQPVPLPKRVKGRPWCPECGMSKPKHWPGCSEPEWTVGTDSPDSALRARLLRREACDAYVRAGNRPAPNEAPVP